LLWQLFTATNKMEALGKAPEPKISNILELLPARELEMKTEMLERIRPAVTSKGKEVPKVLAFFEKSTRALAARLTG
jgi:hypothetical protein